MQVSFGPMLLALSINPRNSSYALLQEGRAFAVNVLKTKSARSGRAVRAAGACRHIAFGRVETSGLGLPLLREALAWFECEIVGEYPAGDHALVVGKVIDGKLLDSEAEPLSYRQTGAMDGASTLFPDAFPAS